MIVLKPALTLLDHIPVAAIVDTYLTAMAEHAEVTQFPWTRYLGQKMHA